MAPRGEQAPQPDRERLVMVVLADEDDRARGIPRRERRPIVRQAEERRLFDQHVLARLQGPQRQIEMELRRHGDDHGIDRRIGDRGEIVAVARSATELAAIRRGLVPVATGVARDDLAPERPKMPAVHTCDEAAPEKGEAHRLGHLEPQS